MPRASRTPRIRRATRSDYPALRRLEDLAFQPWRRASAKSLHRSLAQNSKGESGHQSVWVIPHPTRAHEFAALLVLWHHRTRLRVYDVATSPDPEVRGQGFGYALMRHTEALAKEAGCRDVSLEADARDTALIRWYEGQGYTIRERMPHFYVGGRPAVRMRKDLQPGSALSPKTRGRR